MRRRKGKKNPNQPDMWGEGQRRAEEGAQRAADHAGQEWQVQAYRYLCMYMTNYVEDGTPFSTEDVRNRARLTLDDPPDERAWGHVMLRARRAGLIVRAGFKFATDPIRHNGISTLWKKANV